jgi:hypothetical protein
MFFTSCETRDDECDFVFPKQPIAGISIVDSEGNSLIGEDNVYKPSEITLSDGAEEIPLEFIEFREVTRMSFYFGFMISEKKYFLKLNETETDTINMTIHAYPTKCFGMMKEIEKFSVNGEEIEGEGDIYVIQK